MKKILSFVLCLAMLLSLGLPALAEAPAVRRTLYSGEVTTLNYLLASAQNEQVVAANVIDTLVEYDRYGNLLPSLALSWENSADGLVWTFKLREDVKWVDYQGNEKANVTANDFVAAAKYIVTPENESPIANQMSLIKNASEYYAKEVADFAEVGVKALDDYTLEYTLSAVTPYFLSALTYVNFLPAYGPLLDELGKDFGTACDKLYYCGAFRLAEFEPQVKRIYVKNELNWDAANVFIDKMEYTYNAEAATLAPTAVLRDEVDYALIDTDILDDWKSTHPEMISRGHAIPDYSYFYTFNFDPKYDAEYGPENWLIAVNNSNFRHSIMSAFDRQYAMSAAIYEDAESLTQYTITPKTFAVLDGVDYSAQEVLTATADNFFYGTESIDKALEYKAKAIEELTAAGATFPVTMVLSYLGTDTAWEQELILLKQQLENALGTDYINCELYAGPSTGFLATVRRGGLYSFMRCNWGADYQDPETFAEPFKINKDAETGAVIGNTYNRMDLMLATENQETIDILNAYYAAADEARAETSDMAARYEKFAKAEAMLIENALFIPFFISQAEYQVSKLNTYEGAYASFGMSILRFKGQKLYDHFITPEENAAFFADWQAEMAK